MRSIYFTIRLELPTELLLSQQLVTEEVEPSGGVWFRFMRPFRYPSMDPTPYGDGPWLATGTGNGVSTMYSLTVKSCDLENTLLQLADVFHGNAQTVTVTMN